MTILGEPQHVVHEGHEVHEDVPAGDESPELRPFVSFVLFVDALLALTVTLYHGGDARERKSTAITCRPIVAAIGGTGQANAADTARNNSPSFRVTLPSTATQAVTAAMMSRFTLGLA